MRTAAVVLLFVVFTICSAGGLLLFKHSWARFAEDLQAGRWFSTSGLATVLGAGLYAISFLVWLVIVTRLPLTIAYPVAIGLSLVGITLGAAMWLGEPLGVTRILGAALILAGIVFVTRS